MMQSYVRSKETKHLEIEIEQLVTIGNDWLTIGNDTVTIVNDWLTIVDDCKRL